MPVPKLNPLAELLSRSRLAVLDAEARRLEGLRETIRRLLPPELAPWCLGAEVREGGLVVYMASAAAATSIRYREQALLAGAAAALGEPFQRLLVRVMPDPPLPPTPKPAPRELTAAVRQLLEQTAESVSDEALARSLQRLAGRHGSRDD